jgi:hypothetical protein
MFRLAWFHCLATNFEFEIFRSATNPLYRPARFRIVPLGIDEKERALCRV